MVGAGVVGTVGAGVVGTVGVLLLLASPSAAAEAAAGETLALLLPDPVTHTKLVPQPEAVEWLASLRGRPVAVVAVVGAYRSGKSWLLNELMQDESALTNLKEELKGFDSFVVPGQNQDK